MELEKEDFYELEEIGHMTSNFKMVKLECFCFLKNHIRKEYEEKHWFMHWQLEDMYNSHVGESCLRNGKMIQSREGKTQAPVKGIPTESKYLSPADFERGFWIGYTIYSRRRRRK